LALIHDVQFIPSEHSPSQQTSDACGIRNQGGLKEEMHAVSKYSEGKILVFTVCVCVCVSEREREGEIMLGSG
jgi:hypothetical protein